MKSKKRRRSFSKQEREKRKEAAITWQTENPERYKRYQREYRVKQKYGITLDEYEELLHSPCGICGRKSEVLDHCHKTNEIRGPLCQKCNRGLGNFNDDPAILSAAMNYLER